MKPILEFLINFFICMGATNAGLLLWYAASNTGIHMSEHAIIGGLLACAVAALIITMRGYLTRNRNYEQD